MKKRKELSEMVDILCNQIERNRHNMSMELLNIWSEALAQTETELSEIQKPSGDFHEGDYVLYIPENGESDLSRMLYVLKENISVDGVSKWMVSADEPWNLNTATFGYTIEEKDLLKVQEGSLPKGFSWHNIGDFTWLESPDGIPWVVLNGHMLMLPEEGYIMDMDMESFKKMAERNVSMLLSAGHVLKFHAEMFADAFLLEMENSWPSGEMPNQCEMIFAIPIRNAHDEMLRIRMEDRADGKADIFIKHVDQRMKVISECAARVELNKKSDIRKSIIHDILIICRDCDFDETRIMDIPQHTKKLIIARMFFGGKHIWEMARLEKDIEAWKEIMGYLDSTWKKSMEYVDSNF